MPVLLFPLLRRSVFPVRPGHPGGLSYMPPLPMFPAHNLPPIVNDRYAAYLFCLNFCHSKTIQRCRHWYSPTHRSVFLLCPSSSSAAKCVIHPCSSTMIGSSNKYF